jgi:regulator of sigma E protease
MVTLIVFIITLGILIFVHELGHFVVARRNGIKVDEFGFGFPPRFFGIQCLTGKKKIVLSRKEKINVEISDEKRGSVETIRETAVDKVEEVDEYVPVKKWRFIRGKRDTEEEWENKDNLKEGTIYSINWIPIGGFVKIKGEDGASKKDPDSFASKSAWQRIKVLLAGVAMNFVLAWLLFSAVLMMGAPKEVSEGTPGSKVQIIQVIKDSPAAAMGMKEGDEILEVCASVAQRCEKISAVTQFQKVVSDNKGQKIILKIKRGESAIQLEGIPRLSPPEGQGPLGVSPAQTAIVRSSFFQAFYQGLVMIFNFLVLFFNFIKDLLMGKSTGMEISGPVKIYSYTGQVAQLGLIYVMNFIAILSLNLGIVNAFPIPALDGGRVLFILISKIKKKPLAEETEHAVNTIGFVLLMTLMAFVTLRDVVSLDIWDKLRGIF